jgi:hypothetical protein
VNILCKKKCVNKRDGGSNIKNYECVKKEKYWGGGEILKYGLLCEPHNTHYSK